MCVYVGMCIYVCVYICICMHVDMWIGMGMIVICMHMSIRIIKLMDVLIIYLISPFLHNFVFKYYTPISTL